MYAHFSCLLAQNSKYIFSPFMSGQNLKREVLNELMINKTWICHACRFRKTFTCYSAQWLAVLFNIVLMCRGSCRLYMIFLSIILTDILQKHFAKYRHLNKVINRQTVYDVYVKPISHSHIGSEPHFPTERILVQLNSTDGLRNLNETSDKTTEMRGFLCYVCGEIEQN